MLVPGSIPTSRGESPATARAREEGLLLHMQVLDRAGWMTMSRLAMQRRLRRMTCAELIEVAECVGAASIARNPLVRQDRQVLRDSIADFILTAAALPPAPAVLPEPAHDATPSFSRPPMLSIDEAGAGGALSTALHDEEAKKHERADTDGSDSSTHTSPRSVRSPRLGSPRLGALLHTLLSSTRLRVRGGVVGTSARPDLVAQSV